MALYRWLVLANALIWAITGVVFHNSPVLLSLAGLAWLFGLRHALDADHLAAIDNVVRKLMNRGTTGYSVGLFFSLGHSTIVVLACAFLAGLLGTTAVQQFDSALGMAGAIISASFLFLIAAANFNSLVGLLKDRYAEATLPGGLLTHFLRPVFNAVTRPSHMYLVGFLFGLGFDTATEIGLLGVSATQASQGLDFWKIMIFPTLFTAGMTAVDTLDSVLMSKVYGATIVNPRLRVWYNLTLTSLTAFFAVIVGGMEVIGYGLW